MRTPEGHEGEEEQHRPPGCTALSGWLAVERAGSVSVVGADSKGAGLSHCREFLHFFVIGLEATHS
ncbi:MAG: hypothetical protein P8Y44_06725, partial [Acidobacteriota bacterium]